MYNIKQQLLDITGIQTMSHSTIADKDQYQRVVTEQAAMVDAGLITMKEATRTIRTTT